MIHSQIGRILKTLGFSLDKKNSAETKHQKKTFPDSKFTPFIVLTRSRTGSSMLISFLDSHPNIIAEGEIFHTIKDNDCLTLLEKVFAQQSPHIKAKGFKIFYYHPLDDEQSDIWKHLVNIKNLHVIHLKRRNILRTLISRKIAGSQKVWSVKKASNFLIPSQSKSIEFNALELEKGFIVTREWEKKGDDLFRNHPLLNVFYEDLVKEPEESFKKITGFLGVCYVQPSTDLQKQNPEKTTDLLLNFDELKSHFANTEWQQFFDG